MYIVPLSCSNTRVHALFDDLVIEKLLLYNSFFLVFRNEDFSSSSFRLLQIKTFPFSFFFG